MRIYTVQTEKKSKVLVKKENKTEGLHKPIKTIQWLY